MKARGRWMHCTAQSKAKSGDDIVMLHLKTSRPLVLMTIHADIFSMGYYRNEDVDKVLEKFQCVDPVTQEVDYPRFVHRLMLLE
jgi:hypothetical protein